jgi:hypothetical protein
LPRALTRILPRWLTRILPGVLVGALGGFLSGVLLYGYKCEANAYQCYPTHEVLIGLMTVAGLITGLVVSQLRRSMTWDLGRSLIAAATAVFLLMLVADWMVRSNAWWNCADLCSPYAT